MMGCVRTGSYCEGWECAISVFKCGDWLGERRSGGSQSRCSRPLLLSLHPLPTATTVRTAAWVETTLALALKVQRNDRDAEAQQHADGAKCDDERSRMMIDDVDGKWLWGLMKE